MNPPEQNSKWNETRGNRTGVIGGYRYPTESGVKQKYSQSWGGLLPGEVGRGEQPIRLITGRDSQRVSQVLWGE